MKKVVLALIFMSFLMGCCVNANTNAEPEVRSIADYSDYGKINPEKIKMLRIIRYTEAGSSEKIVKDKAKISSIYNHLKNIKILGEADMSCTDNTTIYSFILDDDSKVSLEIECEWIVINGKNYRFK